MLFSRDEYDEGLSPRVRGNRGAVPPRVRPARSIPACAGEPTLPEKVVRLSTVYPRVCGGTAIVVRLLSSSMGLSPRVRGNRLSHAFSLYYRRSIPACAGEPILNLVQDEQLGVYPRVCGGTC